MTTELKAQLQQAQTETGRLSTAIASCKDNTERLRLMRELKTAQKNLDAIANKIARIEKAERLKAQQSTRDKLANTQDNACGKTRNRQRDIT